MFNYDFVFQWPISYGAEGRGNVLGEIVLRKC